MKTIVLLVITNTLTLVLLTKERNWTEKLMATEGVEELVYGDEWVAVPKVEVEWSRIDTEWAQEQAQIEAYEQYDPWDEDKSAND